MTQPFTASEMRAKADWLDKFSNREDLEIGDFGRGFLAQSAQMLRQAADAMEAAEKATRPFTDADLATFAAMQDKGEG